MIKIKKLTEEGISGFSIVLLYIMNATFTYSTHKGEHVNMSLGLLCLEGTVGLSIWKRLLP